MAESEIVLRLRNQISELEGRVRAQQAELDSLRIVLASPSSDNEAAPGSLLWRGCPSLERGVVRPHVVTLRDQVYVGGGNSKNLETSRRVYKYGSRAEKWESLPITPHTMFSLAVVNGFITVIGGVNTVSSLTTAELLNFDASSKKWKKSFPAMSTRRCAASATATATHTVVAGGLHEDGKSYLSLVEVLDKTTLQWSSAAPLPKPVAFMSITACGVTDRIYLLGGLTKQGSIRSIFSCVTADLVSSTPTTDGDGGGAVWEDIAQTPYHRMGCIAMGGKLVVASGLNEDDRVTTTVHALDPTSREWTTVGEMAAARSSCSLATVAEGRLMVIGGYVNPRNWMMSLTTDVMECVNLKVKLAKL